jgi:hypothetical protein
MISIIDCDVCYNFSIKMMFRSFFPPVVSKRDYLWYLCLCAIVVSSTCVFVWFFLLCTICWQFLWMVHFFLPLRYCYACYISICILNRCNHGHDLSRRSCNILNVLVLRCYMYASYKTPFVYKDAISMYR